MEDKFRLHENDAGLIEMKWLVDANVEMICCFCWQTNLRNFRTSRDFAVAGQGQNVPAISHLRP